MKTVRDACELQPDVLSIKLSDQVERLYVDLTSLSLGGSQNEPTRFRW